MRPYLEIREPHVPAMGLGQDLSEPHSVCLRLLPGRLWTSAETLLPAVRWLLLVLLTKQTRSSLHSWVRGWWMLHMQPLLSHHWQGLEGHLGRGWITQLVLGRAVIAESFCKTAGPV